jgi:hypothetical protein
MEARDVLEQVGKDAIKFITLQFTDLSLYRWRSLRTR